VPNALRRILSLIGFVALAAAVSLGAGASAHAAANEAAPTVTLVSPLDGATVPARHVLVSWASSAPAASYDVRWGTAEALDADGLIIADGSVSGVTESRFDIPDLADLDYHWQVRAIGTDGSPGPWSAAFSFTVLAGTGEGEQLDTLAPDGAAAPEAQPGYAPSGWASADGFLYLAVAFGFAFLLLAVVARAWLRERRAA
jgi:hypothetical protein